MVLRSVLHIQDFKCSENAWSVEGFPVPICYLLFKKGGLGSKAREKGL